MPLLVPLWYWNLFIWFFALFLILFVWFKSVIIPNQVALQWVRWTLIVF